MYQCFIINVFHETKWCQKILGGIEMENNKKVNCLNCTMFYEREGEDFGFCTCHCIYVSNAEYEDDCHEFEDAGRIVK
jgi:hypothetical protein